MKLVAVRNLILQFDLDCPDEELEAKIKEFLKDVNFALPRLFKEQAPQLLNTDKKLDVIVETFE
jgi:hypothetical protein